MPVRVVVAEDDVKQAELVRRYLVREGHLVTVARDSPSALCAVRSTKADVLVLDVMLPGADGFSVCDALSDSPDVSVLMLTARAAEGDILKGFELGADDYMTKPFSPRELVARVRVLLRHRSADRPRKGGEEAPEIIEVGALRIDRLAHEVTREGGPIRLTPGEFTLLEQLAAEPGRAFTRAQLLELLHGSDRYITARTVDMHVMNIRRKIEPDPRQPTLLLTVFGVGYKLARG